MTHKLLLGTVITLLALLLSAPVTTAIVSNAVTVDFAGEVTQVFDTCNIFGGTVSPGDSFFGKYAYNLDTPDSIPTKVWEGSYQHTAPPYGITVHVGSLVFKTDPSNVSFRIVTGNDPPILPMRDLFGVRSEINVSDPSLDPGNTVGGIFWTLTDSTLTALNSDALPAGPPDLSDWDPQPRNAFFVQGACADERGAWEVRGRVIQVRETQTQTVEIDIKPGSYPNCFNNNGNGVIPVAILGKADFDVTEIAPSTVALEGMGLKMAGKSNKILAHIDDVNNDGFDDLVVKIEDEDGIFTTGTSTATLTGLMFDSTPILGTDEVCITPSSG